MNEKVSTGNKRYLLHWALFLSTFLLVALISGRGRTWAEAKAGSDSPDGKDPMFAMVPVGKVVKQEGKPVQIRIHEKFTPGLLGLEKWSHVQVFYWFDRNDTPMNRSILRVHPRGNRENPLTGVFACRAPVRPNLLALSTCRILSVQDGVVTVAGIDAFDGTPVLDLKPYAPGQDSPRAGIKVPAWARKKKQL